MIPRRKKRLAWVLSLVVGVAAAISLILYALTQNIDLFYTPSEMIEGKGTAKVRPEVGQRIRVGGMVVEGSVKRDPKTLEVSFQVTDTGPEVTVLYTGILPDLFREGQGIVAQGVLIEPTVLKATEVLAKHDEEYMPPELAEAMKGIKHVNPNQPDYTGSKTDDSEPQDSSGNNQ
ncbi:cytochrome c maturation protein CcmE [Pseudidiomarina tainanensis]|jgi:cytochrome c-type biogenesis protein CcmE|uniref:Cytochrome c maturation protein CcmE n=1 Tax=Pseudidiomarina tainanensis TaxID=502365 RepID=A0ACD2HJE3_9GAMM|nr:cytochrome c maturation protein CcmE [Pseudidiomarina tainanensis]RZQ56332.1 cytochrome c maturation protein CcmE [Pseudidiomarina tainanensis]